MKKPRRARLFQARVHVSRRLVEGHHHQHAPEIIGDVLRAGVDNAHPPLENSPVGGAEELLEELHGSLHVPQAHTPGMNQYIQMHLYLQVI